MYDQKLRNIIKESVKRYLNEGVYDYPDYADIIILDAENDSELYNKFYWPMVLMLVKKIKKGVNLDKSVLADSSMLKKYQQLAFRKYRQEQMEDGVYDAKISPKVFRDHVAERMIEDAENEVYNEKREAGVSESKLRRIVRESVNSVLMEKHKPNDGTK